MSIYLLNIENNILRSIAVEYVNLLTLKVYCDNIMSKKKRVINFMHVIFICTGNICRSAMADGYLKYRIKQMGKEEQVRVSSAGTHAMQGEESPINAKRAIEKYGADISLHTATTLERANLSQATYILVMTDKHKRDVIHRYPELADRVKLLGEYAKDKNYKEIDDPWGYSFVVYEKCAKEIVDSIEGFIEAEL